MQPIILHLDMNSYFATVEQQDNPQWRGKPLGVCEHLGGIIIAASTEAKKWNIKTGTPVWEAKKLYPKIILTKTHPNRYRLYSDRFMRILKDYTAHVEQYSIDEAFLDVTNVSNVKMSNFKYLSRSETPLRGEIVNMADPFEEAAKTAKTIKKRMKKEVGDWLTCSVGIAENKLLAKIASDMQKPDGLVIVQNAKCRMQNESHGYSAFCIHHSAFESTNKDKGVMIKTTDDLYNELKLTDIPGIGTRQEKRLNELGIKTLRDLRDYPESKLVARFGILGHHLYNMGQFKSTWKPVVEQEETIKSIGHMYTLPKEYRQKKFFVPVLYKLCEMVAKRMRAQHLTGNVLHFYMYPVTKIGIYQNLDEQLDNVASNKSISNTPPIGAGVYGTRQGSLGTSKKLGYCLQDGREIFYESVKIFEQCFGKNSGEIKLIGVTIAGLRPESGQLSLFAKDERLQRVVGALDKINEKYGDFTVCRVPVRLAGNVFRDSIGFGRIKEHVRLASFR